jgi:PAS domain S-box-containing protein
MESSMTTVSDEDLRAVLQFAPYPMLVAERTGAILDANTKLADLLGYSCDEMRALRVEDLVPADLRKRHEEYRHSYVSDGGTHTGARPMGRGRELTASDREGRAIPVEIGLEPVRLNDDLVVLCTVVDISLRRQAQQALTESEKRYREMTELAPDIIFRLQTHPTLRLEFVNSAVEALTGYARTELEGQPERWLDIVHPDDRELVTRLGGDDGPQRFHVRLIARDDTIRWLAANVKTVTEAASDATYVHGTARDVTAQRETERRLEHAEAQLQQAQKLEAIGRLAGGVAHDFNNLLTVIMSFAGFVMDELGESDPLREDIGEILDASDRATDLIKQLLAFSRKRAISPRVIDIAEHIQGLSKMLRRLLGEDVELEAQVPDSCWMTFLDSGALEQVLVNLAVNARDAMPEGGKLVIEVRNRRVQEPLTLTTGVVAPGDYVEVEVRDDGSGMDEATMGRVFEPFFTTKPVGRGTGLGLATCYGIVQQAGGYVGLTSQLQRGTTFTLLFPRTGRPTAAESVPPSVAAAGAGETVLLAEDDPQVREGTARILKRLGYQVLTAQTPGDALLLCEQQQGDIDLLLTDLVMPRMNGRELAQRLQEIRPKLRVLFMSGHASDTIAEHEQLSDDFVLLQKPFDNDGLARAVREALEAE